MKVDTIITLDNDKDFALLERLELDGSVYFYAAGVTGEEEATGEYLFLEEIKKDEKTFIKKVTDKELLEKLYTIVTKEYYEAATALDEEK